MVSGRPHYQGFCTRHCLAKVPCGQVESRILYFVIDNLFFSLRLRTRSGTCGVGEFSGPSVLLDLVTESTGFAVSEIVADILELSPHGVMPG
jgi:hypothetical protein